MNNNNIDYKINKYINKYKLSDNLESKAKYLIKLSEYLNNQTGGNEQLDILNQKIDMIDSKLSQSNKIYEQIKKHDSVLNQIINLSYDPDTDLVDYYNNTIKKIG